MNPARLVIPLALLADSNAADFHLTDQKQTIQSPAVNEASGLAVSPKDDRFLWTLNDSGGSTDLHLLNTDGEDRGNVTVTNAANLDWEDMASFTLDGKSYLLIADTGDNNGVRPIRTLHILAEPALPADGQKLSGSVTTAWHIDFTYEGGPRDCESVAVDAVAEKIILISKRTKPPEVYEMPLRASKSSAPLVMKSSGTTSVESPAGNALPFASQPVGLDISADRTFAAVVTYYGVFLFPRKSEESWVEAFSQKPQLLPPHALPQAESVAISKDGTRIFVVSEGKNSPIRCYGF